MRPLAALLALVWGAAPVSAEVPCDAPTADLVVVGDSQMGATWATSYFGNFLQKCLAKNHPVGSFAIYGRGGTAPVHWLTNAGFDSVPTIQRDINDNHKKIGAGDDVPLCKKRMSSMIKAHRPKKVLAFFGDNLMGQPAATVTSQFNRFFEAIHAAGVPVQNCVIVTPTFEMETASKRNVPSKDQANTVKVMEAVKASLGGRCLIQDGMALMKHSPYALVGPNDTKLKRVPVARTSDCGGAAANDNIHVCGEAARYFAERVCDALR